MIAVRLLCVCLVWSMGVGAADRAATDDAARELVRRWLLDNGGIGLSVGVYADGQAYFYNAGATRLDGNKAPTGDTIYEIGPIAKTMTSQILARAVVEGRVTLEDDVERHLGNYPNLANGGVKIRLGHLANMTSQLLDNIPDFTQLRPVPGELTAVTQMRVMEKYTRKEFLSQLTRVAPQREPGSDPGHSNVANMLLGVILEKVYGETFDVILAREIEGPLRMRSGTKPDAKLLAVGYTDDNEPLPPYRARMAWPSGSLRYSASDLLRYAAWQMAERDASVKLAHQPTWYTPDRQTWVAFNWIGTQTPHGRQLRYSGATWGFTSVVELYPDAKLAVVLLSNKAAEGAQTTLRALSAKLVEAFRPEAGLTNPTPAGVPPPAR